MIGSRAGPSVMAAILVLFTVLIGFDLTPAASATFRQSNHRYSRAAHNPQHQRVVHANTRYCTCPVCRIAASRN